MKERYLRKHRVGNDSKSYQKAKRGKQQQYKASKAVRIAIKEAEDKNWLLKMLLIRSIR